MKICYPVKLREDTAPASEDTHVRLDVTFFDYAAGSRLGMHWTVQFTADSGDFNLEAAPRTVFFLNAPNLHELHARFSARIRQICILEDGDEATLLALLNAAIRQEMARIRDYAEQQREIMQENASALQTMTADAAAFFGQPSSAAPEVP